MTAINEDGEVLGRQARPFNRLDVRSRRLGTLFVKTK